MSQSATDKSCNFASEVSATKGSSDKYKRDSSTFFFSSWKNIAVNTSETAPEFCQGRLLQLCQRPAPKQKTNVSEVSEVSLATKKHCTGTGTETRDRDATFVSLYSGQRYFFAVTVVVTFFPNYLPRVRTPACCKTWILSKTSDDSSLFGFTVFVVETFLFVVSRFRGRFCCGSLKLP